MAAPRTVLATLATAVALLSAACSSPESRACQVDANCFVDERCLAGFCQVDPRFDTGAQDADSPDAPDTNTSDTDAPDTDADANDAPSTCEIGLDLCLDSCVDTQTDPDFCGSCTNSCTDAEQCIDGQCVFPNLPETGFVDIDGNTGASADIALDANGFPHISYLEVTTGDVTLRYAHWDGNAWQSQDVLDIEGTRPTHIAVDAQGNPHIVFGNATPPNGEELLYATLDGQNWVIETVNADTFALHYDLALDPDGAPHIAFYENSVLKLATRTGAGAAVWTAPSSQNIDATGDPGRGVAIIFDDDGLLHAAYRREALGGELVFASRNNTLNWSSRVVLGAGSPGNLIDLTRDPLGRFHIATRSTSTNSNSYLTYAYSNADPLLGADSWTTVIAQNHPTIAFFITSIAVTPQGRTFFGYQTAEAGNFGTRVLSFIGGESFEESFSSPTTTTSRTSLAADNTNGVHIVYSATRTGNSTSGLYYHRISP